jgi:hypothetical protein
VEALESRVLLAGRFIAVGTDVGIPAEVRIFMDTDGDHTYETLAASFRPFGEFAGGVRIAFGDFDGDNSDEIAVAAGPGGGPHVIIFNLNANGFPDAILDSFYAYDPAFSGGVFIAAGDLDGDGRDELITGADAGGGPHVRVFSDLNDDGRVSDEVTDSFYAYGPGFTGGVRVAVGNVKDFGVTGVDVPQQLITGAGPGGGPHVKAWDDPDGDRRVSDDPLFTEFFAYSPDFSAGVYVATLAVFDSTGPLSRTSPSRHRIVVGPGGGGLPVRLFDGVSPTPIEEIQAYPPGFLGGVRVAAGAITLVPLNPSLTSVQIYEELITGAGPGGGPHVKVIHQRPTFLDTEWDEVADEFFAFSADYRGGIFVAYGEGPDLSATGSLSAGDLLSILEELDRAVPGISIQLGGDRLAERVRLRLAPRRSSDRFDLVRQQLSVDASSVF